MTQLANRLIQPAAAMMCTAIAGIQLAAGMTHTAEAGIQLAGAVPRARCAGSEISAARTQLSRVPIWAATLYMYLIRHKNRQYSMKTTKLYLRYGEPGDPSQADLSLGRPTTTYRQWCEAQRPAAR